MAREQFNSGQRHEWIAVAGIIVVAAAIYLLLLLTGQSYADGDECVVGIMARHILDGRHYPLMFYGQPYGGGGVIEAWLAFLPFKLFGASSVSLKLVAVVLSVVTLILLYRFTRQTFGLRVALVATSIYAFAVPMLEWHSKVRGGMLGFRFSPWHCLCFTGRQSIREPGPSIER